MVNFTVHGSPWASDHGRRPQMKPPTYAEATSSYCRVRFEYPDHSLPGTTRFERSLSALLLAPTLSHRHSEPVVPWCSRQLGFAPLAAAHSPAANSLFCQRAR
ncbi:hypothetical protein DFH06DRAFT_1127441 [Mycena polygramma]|nr:hypothetical protein DFH06DRAFT_1127441 [Mycena polygramma]